MESETIKINVLVSTIDEGIEVVGDILLPHRIDVDYIISHQYRDEKHLPIPTELLRKDVFISQILGQGLTKSRNNAIRLATGNVCVIADDDVHYKNEYFDTIIDVFKENDVDIACFKIFTGEGNPEYKKYPQTEKIIDNISDYCKSSIEITFKPDSVKNGKICFDERFGLGSRLMGGEENLFISDAIDAGLKIKFFPFYIVQHPYESTIKSFPKYHTGRIQVGGAIDARLHGKMAIIKAFVITLKKLPDLLCH